MLLRLAITTLLTAIATLLEALVVVNRLLVSRVELKGNLDLTARSSILEKSVDVGEVTSADNLAEVDHALAEVVVEGDVVLVEKRDVHALLASVESDLEGVVPGRLSVLVVGWTSLDDLVANGELCVRIHLGKVLGVEVELCHKRSDNQGSCHFVCKLVTKVQW